MADCLFCGIVEGKFKASFVYQDERAVAFRDLHPQAPTHVLIVPRKHIASLGEAGKEDAELLGHLQFVAGRLAREAGLTSGFRLVTNSGKGAGQSVDHLHYHLLGGRAMAWPPG